MNLDTVSNDIIKASNTPIQLLQEFAELSQRLIDSGKYQQLSITGFKQAIDNLAYYTTLAAMSNILGAKDDSHDYEKLDDTLYTIAFASGLHPAIINCMVDVQCDHYMDMFEQYLISQHFTH